MACGGARAPATPAPEPAPPPSTPPGAATTPPARATEPQYRYEVVEVADTTFTFVAPGTPWLSSGERGIVVDPRRRDALVARFRALHRSADSVVALVTGQTMKVTSDHVVLLRPPPPARVPTVKQRQFWLGVVTGGLAGVIVTIITR
jgi:hypothetical protein